LERAEKLLNGLASTKEGWEKRKKILEKFESYLIGDCLLAAAFLSYAGPFPSEYRDKLTNEVLKENIKKSKIPYNANYSFSDFLVKPEIFLHWITKHHLPDDDFSKDNAVLVMKGRKWPLMIDP